MAFSALNIGTQMMAFTGNKQPQLRIASKPVAGGSFTPNTLEAAFVLRSSLDYQFESAFLTKYKQLMQNRLNDLQKKLEDAYKNTLNASLGQQIGERAANTLRADVRLDGLDGSNGVTLIDGVDGATGFEDLGIDPTTDLAEWSLRTGGSDVDSDQLDNDPGEFPEDNIAGYTRFIEGDPIHMRSLLEFSTAAGNVGGDINVTMRVEDDPPAPTELNAIIDEFQNLTSSIMGGPPPPTYFNQIVREESTQYKTGGFWSTINYLYNFAPREMKYSYAVGYTAQSDEAGDEHMLIEGKLVDMRDNVYFDDDGTGPGQDTDNADEFPAGAHVSEGTNIFTSGSRVKWASFDPLQGYQTEYSGTSARYSSIINRQHAWISGSSTNNSGNVNIADQVWWGAGDERADNTTNPGSVQHIVDGVHFESGTITYYAGQGIWGDNVTGMGGQAYAGSNIQEGTIFRQRVGWNSGSKDERDGDNDNADTGTTRDGTAIPGTTAGDGLSRGAITSSLFFNHYEVETRTVEFNNGTRHDQTGEGAGEIYVHGGMERSWSVDASKSYNLLKDPVTGVESVTRSSGNPADSFNGEFVQGLHRIHSVNGQDVASNSPKQANPILGDFELGRYEGVYRALHMSRNIVPYVPVTQTEVNASQVTPTDWHQSEVLVSTPDNASVANGKIWFPWKELTLFSEADGPNVGYVSDVNAVDPENDEPQPRQVVQFRTAFEMDQDEALELNPAAGTVAGAGDPIAYTETTTTVNAGSTTTVINVADTTGLAAGMSVTINGETQTIASVGAGSITLSAALTAAPTAGDAVGLNYSAAPWIQDNEGYLRPTYSKRDYLLDIELEGVYYNPSATAFRTTVVGGPGTSLSFDVADASGLSAGMTIDVGGSPAVIQSIAGTTINLTPASALPVIPAAGTTVTASSIYDNARVFVNGRELDPLDNSVYEIMNVTNIAGDVHDYTVRVNIGDYIKEGENVIVIQTADGEQINVPPTIQDYREGMRVVEAGGPLTGDTNAANDTISSGYINDVLLTGYQDVSEAVYNPSFERNNIAKIQSRWQSRIVPETVMTQLASGAASVSDSGKLARYGSDPDFTGSNHKVSNTFIEIIMQALNKERYRDIFTMGLWSKLNKLAIQGQASLPNQASLEGNLSVFFDFEDLRMVVNQDKLIAKS